MKIFYADDDADDLELFSEAIKQLKLIIDVELELWVFDNGEKLLKELIQHKKQPLIVFLDINMPKMSGFQVLHEIRRHEDFAGLPVVMYSTSSDRTSIITAFELGASKYAIKPYSFLKITDILTRVINIDWEQYVSDEREFLLV